MADILVRDLDPRVVEGLKRRASRHGRSLQGEVKSILEQSAEMLSPEEMLALVERFQAETAGRMASDSADLIREDRDR